MFRAMSIRNIASTALKLSPEAAATAYRITEVEKILENNDYFNKYKSALEDLKKSDPVEYLRRLDSLSKLHLKPEKPDQPESAEEEQKKTDDQINQVVSGSQKAPTGLPFDLNKLLKIELMQDKSVSEVSDIWKKYFATENSICAIIPKKKYTQISTLASVCPQFIYPIPQKDGYEFMVGEWKNNMLFFTSLAHYQKHGDNAPVACSMHHYTNLQESHGIVLMASRIDPSKISIENSQMLAYCVELFYGTDDGELVRTFRYKPEEFQYQMVVDKIDQLIQNTIPRKPNPPQSKKTQARLAKEAEKKKEASKN